MSYATYESSVELGRPVELYHFTIGATHYRYTSAADSVTFGGNLYTTQQIARSAIKQTNENRQQEVEITLPTENDVASKFIGIIPADTVYLTISRYHRGDAEELTLWTGVIVGASYVKQGGECTMKGATVEGVTGRTIPRFKYQGLCNHILFSTDCGVNRESFKFEGTCGAVSGNTVTVNGVYAAHGDNWCVGSYLNFSDDDFRLVIAQSGDVLTLYLAFENSPIGQTLTCYGGCNHTIIDCETKFSNLERYGGFPFIPELNPFVTGV